MTTEKNITISNDISLADLARKIKVSPAELIKSLMNINVMVTANKTFNPESAISILEKIGIKAIHLKSPSPAGMEKKSRNRTQVNGNDARPPIVTVMGHVDHGKTSLLDYIRKTNIAKKERGGITQGIGAYKVDIGGNSITFLDTPGHEAFTEMRSRGAYCTDIVILVVAADDGVMPQTIEAIKHAQAANVSIVVAITKTDRQGGNIENIKKQLANHNVISEDWGGEVLIQGVSCISGDGIPELLDNIFLQAEMLQLKTKTSGAAVGTVIESRLDKHCGPLASIIITQGTLKKGDFFIVGNSYGKVKSLKTDKGKVITQARPSDPVEILGCMNAPLSGDEIMVVKDEKTAKKMVQEKSHFQEGLGVANNSSIDTNLEMNDKQEKLNIILKSDSIGSAEAVSSLLKGLSTDSKRINVVYSSVGEFNESDVHLAVTTKAILLGFNIQASKKARELIKKENVTFHICKLIYAVSDLISGILKDPGNEFSYIKTGAAEVRNIFKIKNVAIAGCMVMDGILKRHFAAHIIRKNKVIHRSNIDSIKRFKENVDEVQGGMECGIIVQGFDSIEIGDKIECYEKITNEKAH